MAVHADTVIKYDIVGDREDLSDVIYDISPDDTPLFSKAGRGKATNTLHEWLNDELATGVSTNAHLDGDDSETEASTQPTRTGNYTQISKKVAQVSGTSEALRKAGRKGELSRIMTRKMKELKLDMETSMFANLGANAGAAATARVSAGLGAIVKTNVDLAGDGTNPVYVGNLPTDPRNDGTQRAFTATILQNVQTLAWGNGGSPKVLYVGAFNKAAVSAFAGIATKTIEQSKASPAVIVGSADVYVGEFGNITVMPSRNSRTRDAWLIDHDYIAVDYLRPFHEEKLAKTGDSNKRHIVVEWTLKVSNEQAHGLAADLTTA